MLDSNEQSPLPTLKVTTRPAAFTEILEDKSGFLETLYSCDDSRISELVGHISKRDADNTQQMNELYDQFLQGDKEATNEINNSRRATSARIEGVQRIVANLGLEEHNTQLLGDLIIEEDALLEGILAISHELRSFDQDEQSTPQWQQEAEATTIAQWSQWQERMYIEMDANWLSAIGKDLSSHDPSKLSIARVQVQSTLAHEYMHGYVATHLPQTQDQYKEPISAESYSEERTERIANFFADAYTKFRNI